MPERIYDLTIVTYTELDHAQWKKKMHMAVLGVVDRCGQYYTLSSLKYNDRVFRNVFRPPFLMGMQNRM